MWWMNKDKHSGTLENTSKAEIIKSPMGCIQNNYIQMSDIKQLIVWNYIYSIHEIVYIKKKTNKKNKSFLKELHWFKQIMN